MAETLKERLEPYISVRVFGLTLAGLVGVSLAVVIGLALSSGQQEVETSVVLPLAEQPPVAGHPEETPAESTGEVTPGHLSPADIAVTEPVAPPADPVTATHGEQSQPAHTVTTAPALPDPRAVEQPPQHGSANIGSPPVVPSPDITEKKPAAVIEDAVAGLHQSTPQGMVPVIRKDDGMTAFKAYSVEFMPPADTKAIISLVMVDFGLSQAVSEKAIANLPGAVTFSLSPYSREAQKLTTAARQGGHEVWLHVPIQHITYGTDDTGSLSILVNASIDQNKARLMSSLGKATGYAGVIDMDTPAFGDAAADLDSIYSAIVDRGLALAQGNPKDTMTGAFAATHKAAFIQNDIWIDRSAAPADVAQELEKLRQIALNGNIAVGFFHPYPAVIAAIKEWSVQLGHDNIHLAPLSASIKQKTASPQP